MCIRDSDYGDKESAVICNTVGNVFAGQVVAETAKTLSERFGKMCIRDRTTKGIKKSLLRRKIMIHMKHLKNL